LNGQRAKLTNKTSKAGLPNFWSATSKMAPFKFWGITKTEPAACQVGKKLFKENSHHSVDEHEKYAEFTLQRCNMLVDIGLVPLKFYWYGSDGSDEVGKHQDGNATQSITGTR
jgi:hypothetical protein